MATTKKVLLLAGAALLAMATLFGCSLLLRDGSEQSDWHIKLNINDPSAAKGITVNEYDVTALAVEVYDPNGELIEEISWQVADGQQSYLIPVSEQGQYEIFVTHISDENGKIVEAEESALFNIQAMVITVIDIIPGCIGVINVSGGGEEPDKEDGTLTVAVTDLAAQDDTAVYIGVFPPGADLTSWETLMQASGEIWLLGGAGSETAVIGSGGEDLWIGTGGDFYDVYIWVDLNRNLPDGNYYPEPGLDLQLSDFPVTLEIDGDTNLYFQGSDFVEVP